MIKNFIIPLLIIASLSGCSMLTRPHYNVYSTVGIQFSHDAFICKPKPTKPDKTDGTYKESDVATYLNHTEEARADCELKLHAAGDTYQKQVDLVQKSNPKDTK